MPKYEYKLVTVSGATNDFVDEKLMNEIAAMGYRLVNSAQLPTLGSEQIACVVFIFEREEAPKTLQINFTNPTAAQRKIIQEAIDQATALNNAPKPHPFTHEEIVVLRDLLEEDAARRGIRR